MCVAGNDSSNKASEIPLLPAGTFVLLKGRSIIDRRKDSTVKAHCNMAGKCAFATGRNGHIDNPDLPLETLSEGLNSRRQR